MNLCTFGIHKWGKFSAPQLFKKTIHYAWCGEPEKVVIDKVLAHERTCERCGKHQIKDV
jgi:transposase-like protein